MGSRSIQKNCTSLNIWVENYDGSSVHAEPEYPPNTLRKMATVNFVFASNLVRSIDLVQLLQPTVATVGDEMFRETELLISSVKFWDIKLSPGAWAVVLRVLWLCGYLKDCESYREAKRRAAAAAQRLIEYAKEYGSVALVGHGFFNLLIAKQLRKKGCEGLRKTGTSHWTCTTYYL